MMRLPVGLLLGLLLSACVSSEPDFPPSPNIVQLNEYTFGQVHDGRLWFVKLYAPWCRNCKRLIYQWDLLAQELIDRGQDDIVLARINCEDNENFCVHTLLKDVSDIKMPTLKVYYNGKDLATYKADFYLTELMLPFIMKMKSSVKDIDLEPELYKYIIT